MDRDDIAECVGADDWQFVADEFRGQSEKQILATLNEMYRHEDNVDLAHAIWEELQSD